MEKITSKKIGIRINTLLADKGMKQKDLAKKLGVTDNTISYYASGERTPNLEQVIKISEIFNVSADYILGLSDIQTRNETIQGINAEIGLSQKSISTLKVERTCGDTEIVEFLDYIISNPNLTRIINAIHTTNKFENNPQIARMEIDGNAIKMEMNAIYKTYVQDEFWKMVKGFTLKSKEDNDGEK